MNIRKPSRRPEISLGQRSSSTGSFLINQHTRVDVYAVYLKNGICIHVCLSYTWLIQGPAHIRVCQAGDAVIQGLRLGRQVCVCYVHYTYTVHLQYRHTLYTYYIMLVHVFIFSTYYCMYIYIIRVYYICIIL